MNMNKNDLVKRNFQCEFRTEENSDGIVIGVPIVFDTPTDIGGQFEEVIDKDAISEEILKTDIGFYFNHDIDAKRLARAIIPLDKKGGMILEKKDNCIEARINLNLERTDAKDLYIAIQDGTINAMSFMFGVEQDVWEREDTDYPKRIIKKISPLVEISAVNYPAYKTTSIHTARADTSTEIDVRAKEIACKQFLEETKKQKEELELLKLKSRIL